jgi:hypothetical protein
MLSVEITHKKNYYIPEPFNIGSVTQLLISVMQLCCNHKICIKSHFNFQSLGSYINDFEGPQLFRLEG